MKTGIGHLNKIRLKSAKYLTMSYRIRLIATPGLYFSKQVFGWGSIQKIPEKVDFLTKKWGFIQEKPQKQDFSHYLGLYSRVGLQSSGYGIHMHICPESNQLKFSIPNIPKPVLWSPGVVESHGTMGWPKIKNNMFLCTRFKYCN